MPSKPASGDSWRVQFRLNPAESEADAILLERLLQLSEQKVSDKDICVTALRYYYLDNAGVPETGTVRNLREITQELHEIKRLSIEKIQVLIDILQGRGVSMDDLTDTERHALTRGLDDATISRIFSGVEGEQFVIDDDDDA